MLDSTHLSNIRFPFTAFPDGIFAVAFSHEVKAKQVISIIFMGKKIALFRSEDGTLGAVDSYCAHLGADLSLGIVKKNFLQCPFHGLRFDNNGSCQQQGSSGTYQLHSWDVFERYGLIFISHHPHNNNLNICFPEWALRDWGKPIENCFKIKSHPQEILENSVDKLHFFSVHKYHSAKCVTPLQTIGPEFLINYELERRQGLFGRWDKTKVAMQLDIHAYGLGLSKVEVRLPKYGLEAKQIVCPTPIDGEFIHIRSLTSVKFPQQIPYLPQWLIPQFIKKVFANYVSYIAAKGFLKDFLPDLTIWENKRYVSQPNYLAHDGDFEQYRAWAQQFYRLEPVNHIDSIVTPAGKLAERRRDTKQ